MSISAKFNALINNLDTQITDNDKAKIKNFVKEAMKNSDDKKKDLLPAEPTTEEIMKKLNSIED